MDGLQQTIAKNIRARRELLGLSIAQLAERAQIAKSTLSQIESGAANPTIGTLASIAHIVDLDVNQLITPPEEAHPVLVYRAGTGSGTGSDVSGEGIVGLMVHSWRTGPARSEYHDLTITPGTRTVSASHGFGAYEFVYVVSGEVELGPTDHTEVLQAGDFATYRADTLHLWSSPEGKGGRVWLLVNYPQFNGD